MVSNGMSEILVQFAESSYYCGASLMYYKIRALLENADGDEPDVADAILEIEKHLKAKQQQIAEYSAANLAAVVIKRARDVKPQ